MQKNEAEILKIMIKTFEQDIGKYIKHPIKIYAGDVMYTNKIDLEELKEFINLFIPPTIKSRLDDSDRFKPIPSLRQIFCKLCQYMGYDISSITYTINRHRTSYYDFIKDFDTNIEYDNEFRELFITIITELNKKWYVPAILSQIKQEWYNPKSTLHTSLSEV